MKRVWPILCLIGLVLPAPPTAAEEIRAGVLRVEGAYHTPISRLDLRPEDLGFAGARLATQDNATTGRFMGQEYVTEEVSVGTDGALAALDALLAEGAVFIVTLADAHTTLALADAAGDRALIVNAQAPDDRLRSADCRTNLLHVAPSRAMKTDALAQFLVWKRWRDWVLIHGSHPEDRALAEDYRRAARKFGADIVEAREFEDTGGARRSESGHVLVQKQMPAFMQGLPGHDVVITADEADVFAVYLPYQTWVPRPVAGSAGLRPLSWHPAIEAWGGSQLQNRFDDLAGRPMREEDYQVWMALRVLGEAVTRSGSADPAVIRGYVLGPEFELAAFKGEPLTFRPWNGQLRQPILLGGPRVIVSVSPQEGFLHRVSRLDTLGLDEPESDCTVVQPD